MRGTAVSYIPCTCLRHALLTILGTWKQLRLEKMHGGSVNWKVCSIQIVVLRSSCISWPSLASSCELPSKPVAIYNHGWETHINALLLLDPTLSVFFIANGQGLSHNRNLLLILLPLLLVLFTTKTTPPPLLQLPPPPRRGGEGGGRRLPPPPPPGTTTTTATATPTAITAATATLLLLLLLLPLLLPLPLLLFLLLL